MQVGPETGQPLRRFCLHPAEWCPEADTMLAQRQYLLHMETEFRRVANWHRLDVFWM